MEAWLDETFGAKNWRTVSAYDTSLASDEWLVCMRVGKEEIKGKIYFDYHFWFRASDGYWYNKHGYGTTSKQLDYGINPSAENDSDGWDISMDTDGDGVNETYDSFYSSETIYYAITK